MNQESIFKKQAGLYRKSVRWSEEDNCFIGAIHELAGDCVHGDDPVEVYKELELLAVDLVESFSELEKDLPSPVVELEKISEIRKALNMTQTEFAALLNISSKTLHKWEQDATSPSGAAKSLLLIAQERPDVLKELFVK